MRTPSTNATDTQEPNRLLVTHVHECPVYNRKDIFELDRNFLLPPPPKPLCLTLSSSIKDKKLLIDKHKLNDSDQSFMCHGCNVGSHITVRMITRRVTAADINSVVHMLHQYSFFRLIPESFLESLYEEFTITGYESGTTIIEQGTVASGIYLVISGEVEVLAGKNNTVIAHHGPGGIFGEISVICNSLHNATVRTTTATRILQIRSETFSVLIHQFPSLLRYFYQLLAKRLNKIYLLAARNEIVEIHGKLSEWPLPDLLQTINMNHKTGTLELEFGTTKASVEFYNGNITGAIYPNLVGSEAFYALFKERDGTFNFIHEVSEENSQDRSYAILGDFMSMIMEGLVRADESSM